MKQLVRSLEAETLCDHYVTKETKKLWNIQLIMAEELLRICKKHNLKIWGISGTMLGAVRHKGYIPWDDDMDFAMFREDYDKLQEIAIKEFKAPYFFQSPLTEKGYYRGHSQLRYNDTAMIVCYEAKHGVSFHQGIFIDIFVLDGFPETEDERIKLIELRDNILNYIRLRNYPNFLRGSIYEVFKFKQVKKFLDSKQYWSDIELYKYLEDCFRAYPVNKYERNCAMMFAYLPRCVRLKEWFDETMYVPFENIEIPIPKRYNEVLKEEYGDYMKPVKGVSMHGNNVDIDIEHSYKKRNDALKYNSSKLALEFVMSISRLLMNAVRKIIRK